MKEREEIKMRKLRLKERERGKRKDLKNVKCSFAKLLVPKTGELPTY